MDLPAQKKVSVPPTMLVFTNLNNHFVDNRLQEFTDVRGVCLFPPLAQTRYCFDEVGNLPVEFGNDEPLGSLCSIQLAFKPVTFSL